MRRSRLWLAVTAVAFAAWIGYLFYLTRIHERIVLSRPQFLIASEVVTAHIKSKDGPAIVNEVIFSAEKDLKTGNTIEIPNLRDSFRKWIGDGASSEWDVPGDFILPLHSLKKVKTGEWTAEIVPLPPSPGLPHDRRIYPVTDGTMEQLRAIQIGLP